MSRQVGLAYGSCREGHGEGRPGGLISGAGGAMHGRASFIHHYGEKYRRG